jgi:two-component system, OmpR family, response regulator CpxR
MSSQNAHGERKGMQVLLVDDESQFIEALAERLQLRGFEARVANDGPAALDLLEKDRLKLVVLDLRMPEMDGLEVLRHIKEKWPTTQVIIATGHGDEEDRRKCLELGAFAFLSKPVNIKELSDLLKEAWSKAL